MSKELLEELKEFRNEMHSISKEQLIVAGRPIIKIDPLRVKIVIDGMIQREKERHQKDYRDSGFTDDFGVYME